MSWDVEYVLRFRFVALMVLLGVERGDSEAQADRLLERLLGYRVFPDENDKMNLSLRDIEGGLLLVPQFTLPADTRKGTRPSFTTAAPPDEGRRLFDYFVDDTELDELVWMKEVAEQSLAGLEKPDPGVSQDRPGGDAP